MEVGGVIQVCQGQPPARREPAHIEQPETQALKHRPGRLVIIWLWACWSLARVIHKSTAFFACWSMEKQEQKQKARETWVKVYDNLALSVKLPVTVALPVRLFSAGLSACRRKAWSTAPEDLNGWPGKNGMMKPLTSSWI